MCWLVWLVDCILDGFRFSWVCWVCVFALGGVGIIYFSWGMVWALDFGWCVGLYLVLF